MKLRMIVRQMYGEFIRRYYNSNAVIDDNLIVDFLIEVHKKINLNSISAEWIYNYLIFQFDYWKSKNVHHGNRMSAKKIFAKKSLQRYFSRSDKFNWYNAKLSLKQFDIGDDILYQFRKKQQSSTTYDDIERVRFHNTNKGFANCIEMTTLYDKRSGLCQTCRFRKQCKELLRQNYKAIYIDRYVRKNNNRPLQSV